MRALLSIPISAIALLWMFLAGGLDGQSISPGEILLKLRAGTRPIPSELNPHLVKIEPLFQRSGLRKPSFGLTYKATLAPNISVMEAVEALRGHAGVEFAQPNHLFRTFQAIDDPRRPDQFHLDLINWPALITNLPAKRKDVIVAVIDSGIEYTHEDLAARIWMNEAEVDGRDGIDDDGNGFVDDLRGWDFTDAPTLPGQGDFLVPDNDPADESSHGTQVAGVIGAISDNGTGIAGVADCRLMAVRAGLTFAQGGTFLQEDDLASAIVYAVDNGADILNLSWGSFDRAYVIEDVVQYAAERGVVLVGAAGNSGEPPVAYPAALRDVISVSAVETTGQLASFSSTGPVLDLVAPGVNIVSTRLDDTYGPRSGSSFAAPQIAGLAALLLSRRPEMSPDQIRGALVTATTDVGEFGWDTSFGAGQADASQLVSFVSGADPQIAKITSPSNDDEVTGSISIGAVWTGPGGTTGIHWARKSDPTQWTLIGGSRSGDGAGLTESIAWPVPKELQDEPIILRLLVPVPGRSRPIEHRLRVRANPADPSVTSIFLGPILAGDRAEWTARWVTRSPTESSLILVSQNGFVRDTLSTARLDRFHEVVLPDQIQTRDLEYQILARSRSGRETTTPTETITIVPTRVPSIGFAEIASLPDGFLADRVSDFDGDGHLEITLMPYVEGQAFSQTQVFEFDNGAFTSIHTTEDSFLPWNIGDVTFDGIDDLLGSSVQRIQLFTGIGLPTDLVLDKSGLWGGDIGDADGDGANEILARSLSDFTIRMIRRQDDGSFKEMDSLVDFSEGDGEMGRRFVLADMDGDLDQDLLVGDSDGDVWGYEFSNGGFFQQTLIPGDDNTDARVIGGGADLDGDGNTEFAVARAYPNDFDALGGWWDLEIYEITQVAPEYVQRISGVAFPGNGIATGDLDGDGQADLAVALIPDLYVIRGDGPDTYRPIYHTPISTTYRPLVADLDQDGQPELVYNADGLIRVVERNQPPDTVQRPEILEAVPVARDRISVKWMPTPGVTSYRLLRSNGASSTAKVTESPAHSYIDTGLTEGDTLTYHVEAILATGNVRSSPKTVVARALPVVVDAERVDEHRISIQYSTAMGDAATIPNGYHLLPQDERPSSVVRDRHRKRVLLSFSSPILEKVTHTLEIALATDIGGALVDPASRTVTFTPGLQSPAAKADFDSDGLIGFSDFLLFAAAFGGNDLLYDLDTDGAVGFSDFLLFADIFGQSV
jgi:subtilisin family serine protease